MRIHTLLFLASMSAAACGGDDDETGDIGNEEEVITTLTLTFAPDGGGDDILAAFDDPDGEGGQAPTIDPIALAAGTTYTMTVAFANGLVEPPEDITEEVEDESDQHQLFFLGTAVDGPASDQPDAPLAHSYTDEDENGLPVGLENTIAAQSGEGTLTVVLRHLPPVNGTAVKTADLADEVAAGGLGVLPGATDAQVDFQVAVE